MTALKYFMQQQLEKLDREQLKQVFEFSEISIANFESKQGSEDAGVSPTIILQNDTISMCHQMRVGERTRPNKIGELHPESLAKLENTVLFILGSYLKKERSRLFFVAPANQNSLYILQLSFVDVAK